MGVMLWTGTALGDAALDTLGLCVSDTVGVTDGAGGDGAGADVEEEAEGEVEGEGDTDGVRVAEGLSEGEKVREGEGLNDAPRLGDGLAVTLTLGDVDGDSEGDAEGLGRAVADIVGGVNRTTSSLDALFVGTAITPAGTMRVTLDTGCGTLTFMMYCVGNTSSHCLNTSAAPGGLTTTELGKKPCTTPENCTLTKNHAGVELKVWGPANVVVTTAVLAPAGE